MNTVTTPPVDMQAYMNSTAALLGLPLAPEHRPGVLRYLQLVAALAPRVNDFALSALTPADESGNNYTPVPAPAVPPHPVAGT